MNAPVPQLLTARQLAEALGVSLDWFYRHRVGLERDDGFPSQLPGFRGRYDPAAVRAWLDRVRGPAGASASTAPPEDDIAMWQRRLDERAAVMAGGR